MGDHGIIHREVIMEFKNGCVLTVPENVTVVFASNAEGRDNAEGLLQGDLLTAGDLVMHMVKKIYNNLDDGQKVQFIQGFVEIIQSKLPKNVQISSVTVRKGVSPEDDDE